MTEGPLPADSLFDTAVLADEAPVIADQPRRIVLIGAGHAHLQIVQWWAKRPIPHAELVLISAFDRAVYSGMIPGVLGGLLSAQECRIDLRRLTDHSRVALIVDRAIRLDPVRQTIELAHQQSLSFDVASINIGSVTRGEALCQQHRMLVSVKPLATLLDRLEPRLQELETQFAAAPVTDRLRFGVVGAGAGGIELALGLERLLAKRGIPATVTLFDGGKELLPGHSRHAARLIRRLFQSRGIRVELGRRVAGCDDDGPAALILDDGTPEPCDLAIWATGAAPPEALKNFSLPRSERGFLLIRPTLRTAGDAPVFVVGDAAERLDQDMPKAGVYAIRQGPVLWHNLRQWLRGEPLQTYEPQPAFLALLSCGDGTAVLDYRGCAVRSRWAWWLKLWIDRRFVRRFR
jgi:pyridine nucleotide-disulfide oxidoreductase family protein